MANIIYITVNGKKQGLISAGCSTYDSIGNKYQEEHKDKILVYSVDHDVSRDQNVNHHPITITKPIDKSSPLLGVAISDNENLHCEIDIYRNSSSGGLEKFYSIKLTNATIKNISVHYPNSLNHNDMQPYESITISYDSITWTHHTAGTSGYSIREDNVF
ncbi:Hcp family type VI secretion system effector [Xenorhabdus sp. Reich]|uniref:Hcp family type VI secretion system effector n=1 Tax=Xenorhabdus littoralis TaxID=2582835 RepID=A0ABU4SK66_9GAMM|nr:Hcp family type VI secretion system effector [Xenorhabdus sp. Reich]MDX7999041.1 Hcp family type VI secretion system effector [Xenorhabdus sp. Reich]